MNLHSAARPSAPGSGAGSARRPAAVFAALVCVALVGVLAVVPHNGLASNTRAAAPRGSGAVQSLTVATTVVAVDVPRPSYTATPGYNTYIAGGSNYDWAKLVLLFGEFPVSDNNVTVITRWMRQENYIDSWWSRNNPLNNGWGSGGGGGLGSYPSLKSAAENAAAALRGHPGYAAIVEAFAASAPTEVTEAAIWASPWASGHYAGGAHWHYSAVPEVTAPTGAW